VLAAILFAIVLSGRVTGPLSRLGEAARRLAAGERVQPARHAGPREVRQLAAAFDSLADELAVSRPRVLQAERVAAWREMARRLAHELKNPLFPIQVSIETLRRALDAAEERGTAEVEFPRLFRESSATILEELRILRGIIDEFSRFTRLPRPELRLTDVESVLAHVAGLHAGGPANGVTVETEVAEEIPLIMGDPDLLSRALANLVANAIEASPPGETVRVRARATPEKVLIEVTDHGPGLNEDERARLFTPYFTSKPGGTGLGLAIAQSIVADHHGHIDVASDVGGGTTFSIVLPAGPAAEKGTPS
jgi:two-component system nitrogen regulation sensor histidine kinase NtrY